MEFRNCDPNAEKVRLYESVRKNLAEIYEVSKTPYRDLDNVNELDLRE